MVLPKYLYFVYTRAKGAVPNETIPKTVPIGLVLHENRSKRPILNCFLCFFGSNTDCVPFGSFVNGAVIDFSNETNPIFLVLARSYTQRC